MRREVSNLKDIITLVIVIALVVLAFVCGIKTPEECYDKGYVVYTIMPNDTIWSIASDIEGNTEKIVYTIRKDNNIEDVGNLKVGQQIVLREEY